MAVILLTTVATPPLLRMRIGATGARPRRDAPPPTPQPESGWLAVQQGVIDLDGTPPVEETIPLAFQAAARTGHARPGPELLDWFGVHRDEPLTWTKDDTASLIRLLRAHEPRVAPARGDRAARAGPSRDRRSNAPPTRRRQRPRSTRCPPIPHRRTSRRPRRGIRAPVRRPRAGSHGRRRVSGRSGDGGVLGVVARPSRAETRRPTHRRDRQ